MSFIIKCIKCGTEREFKEGSNKYEEGTISVNVSMEGDYSGDRPKSIDIDCQNPECFNDVEIEY